VAYARLWNYLIDDVFISVRYASHLAHGDGLVYNAGERVEGYTNFLWTLLLVPSLAFPIDLIGWIKWMNGLWAVAAALLAVRVTASVTATASRLVPGEARSGQVASLAEPGPSAA